MRRCARMQKERLRFVSGELLPESLEHGSCHLIRKEFAWMDSDEEEAGLPALTHWGSDSLL